MRHLLTTIILGIILLMPSVSNGQGTRMDSLEQQLSLAKESSKKIDILTEIYSELAWTDQESALLVANQILDLALTDSKEDVLFGYNLVGLALMEVNKLDSALNYLHKGLDIATEEKDSIYISKINFNLGILEYYAGNLDRCYEYLDKSLTIDIQTKNFESATQTYGTLGAIYLAMEEFDKAREHLLKALELFEVMDDKFGLATTYTNLANLEMRTRNYNEAENLYHQAISLNDEIGDIESMSICYRGLSEIKQATKKWAESIPYDHLSIKNAKIINDAYSIRDGYKAIATAYQNLGNYEKAYEFINEYIAWNDTVIKRQNRDKIIEIQQKYETEKTAQENELLTKESQIKDLKLEKNNEELSKSNMIKWSSIIGLVLLVVLSIVLFNRNKIKQEANKQLQLSNEKISTAYSIIEEKSRDISASLVYAKRLQGAILPPFDLLNKYLPDNFILFKPKEEVSGDFYWFDHVDGVSYVAVADCTGHGVPGAMVSFVCTSALSSAVNELGIREPAEILNKTRELVIQRFATSGSEVKDGMDISLCAIKEDEIVFAGANNPLWIVRKTESLTTEEKERPRTMIQDDLSLLEFRGDKQPVGLYSNMKEFSQHNLKTYKEDVIYLFSDGFADQFGGPKGKKFKYKPFKRLLLQLNSTIRDGQARAIHDTFEEWKGDFDQVDDVCILGVRL